MAEMNSADKGEQQYTPTTGDVREAYLAAEYEERDSSTSDEDLLAEFDRWLATARAEARADALREAAESVVERWHSNASLSPSVVAMELKKLADREEETPNA